MTSSTTATMNQDVPSHDNTAVKGAIEDSNPTGMDVSGAPLTVDHSSTTPLPIPESDLETGALPQVADIKAPEVEPSIV